MKSWKQAWSLARFELKQSKRVFLLLLVIIMIARFQIETMTDSLLKKENFAGPDLIFILVFSAIWAYARRADFQQKKINDRLWTTHANYYLRQLPISKEVIAKRSFLTYLIYTLPNYIIMLVLIYTTIPTFKEMLSLQSFIPFSLIWLCIGLSFGFLPLMLDITAHLINNFLIFCLGIAFYILIIFGSALLIVFTEKGLVFWTIHFAVQAPILSSIIAMIIATTSLYFTPKLLQKRLDSFEYM